MRDISKMQSQDLVVRFRAAAGREREVLGEFLLLLGEIDERRLYADEGYPALYQYVMALGYTEAETFTRIVVARLLRRMPHLYESLVAGRLSLTALRILAPHLSDDNASELVAKAEGQCVREVEKVVAGMGRPKRLAKAATPLALEETPSPGTDRPAPTIKHDKVRHVTAEIVEIRFSAKDELRDKLDRAKAVARTKGVKGTLDDVLSHVLDDYLDRHDAKRKATRRVAKLAGGPRAASTGAAPRPSATVAAVRTTNARSRYVPKAIEARVTARSGYKCSHVDASGRRCSATIGLQLDHIVPFARGGSSTDPDNLRYLCGAHIRLAADRAFGAAYIANRIAERRAPVSHVSK